MNFKENDLLLKLKAVKIPKKFSVLYGTQKFITVFTTASY
jgi:hypothetical protein